MTAAVGRALGTVVVTLHGEITDDDTPHLAAMLRDLIENQGNLKVAVDLRLLTAVTPAGARVFADAWSWAALRRGSLVLSGAQAGVVSTLLAAGVTASAIVDA